MHFSALYIFSLDSDSTLSLSILVLSMHIFSFFMAFGHFYLVSTNMKFQRGSKGGSHIGPDERQGSKKKVFGICIIIPCRSC